MLSVCGGWSSSVAFASRLPATTFFAADDGDGTEPYSSSVFPTAFAVSLPSTGGSFTLLIAIVNCLSKESAPLSVERTQIVYELFTSKLKLAADCTLSLPAPPIWNELLSGNGPPPQPVFSSV